MRRFQRVGSLAVLLVILAVPRLASASAFTINATYGAGMTGPAIAVVNSAIAFYESIFTDPITVNIAFNNDGGLGSSTFFLYNPIGGYSAFSTALANDATSADDAMANVVAAANNPVTGTPDIFAKSATLRAIGINQAAHVWTAADDCDGGMTGAFDGCIGLNLGLTDVAGGPYSLFAVAEHEIDEVLGLGSALGLGIGAGRISPEDLFRYSSAGVRSFARSGSCAGPAGQGPLAYFSIDGGTTNLDGFNNCDNGGDYGDWISHNPAQVQDAFATPSATPFLTANSSEIRALDVIGYTRASVDPVPEPVTLVLFGTGLAGATLARRRGRRSGSK